MTSKGQSMSMTTANGNGNETTRDEGCETLRQTARTNETGSGSAGRRVSGDGGKGQFRFQPQQQQQQREMRAPFEGVNTTKGVRLAEL